MLIGVIIVFNLYVQNPESQIKKFILSSYQIWHISLSNSCTVQCIQDKDAVFRYIKYI